MTLKLALPWEKKKLICQCMPQNEAANKMRQNMDIMN